MRIMALGSLLMLLAGAGEVRAQTIRVVTEPAAFTLINEGKTEGRATEMIRRTLKEAGLHDYTMQAYPWGRSYAIALQEPNVLIYEIIRTPARETQFKWVGELRRSSYALYKLKERSDIKVASLDDAKRYLVAVIREDVREQFLRQHGFTNLLLSGQSGKNFKNLQSGRADLAPYSDTDVKTVCANANFDIAKLERVLALGEMTHAYFAFSKATPDALVERVRAAYERLKADGTHARIMEGRP